MLSSGRMTKLVFVIAVAACGGGTAAKPTAPPPAAPEPAPEPTARAPELAAKPAESSDAAAIAAQAELAEQYDLGKKIYVDKKCASCHGDQGEGNPKNPAVIGPNAFSEKAPAKAKLRKGVTFATAKDVLDFVKAKMPLKKPGTLSDKDAAAVTSWMLSESKVNIEKPLDASNAATVKLR